MSWETIQPRPWYQYKRLWIGLGVAACLGILSLPHLQRYYRQWSGVRHRSRAAEALAAGDLSKALLESKVALAFDRNDIEALRIMAKIAEKAGSPAAANVRRQIDALKPDDPENLLSLVDDCLKGGDAMAADEELKRIKPADQETPRYQSLAGGVALMRGDRDSAESHLTKAVALAPAEDEYRLKLAGVRLNSKQSELRAAAVRELTDLSQKSTQRLPALRLLLADANGRGDSQRAYELADALASDPQASLSDRLTRLSTLHDVRTTELMAFSALEAKKKFYAELRQLQEAAVKNTADLLQLIGWMNDHDFSLGVVEWADSLPTELGSKPPVSVPIADAYIRTSNWKGLKAKLEKANWQKLDFLRFAYLSEALERSADPADAAADWRKAIEGARENPQYLEALATGATQWGEAARAEEAFWKRAALGHPPRWVVDNLWATALKRRDTTQMQKVSKLILDAEPKSVTARNNYISLSLLSGQEAKIAAPLAVALHKENPTNSHVAGTYAFSLYKAGDVDQAVAAVSALTAEERHDPQTSLYYGIFLAAAGKTDEAAPYLAAGRKVPLLPEEEAMADFYRLVCDARAQQARGDSAAADASWGEAFATAKTRSDWLDWMGKTALAWRWTPKAEAAALALASQGHCPAWAAAPLWTAALASGDSARVYTAAKLISETDPKDLAAKGRYVLLSLLSRRQSDGTPRLAESLHKENPANPDLAAAAGLVLLRQGKAEEAVASMRKLPPDLLREPRPALYFGLFLAAAGESEKADEAMSVAAAGRLLPEEKTLAAILGQALQARRLGTAGSSAAWDQAVAAAEGRPDRLELLGRMALAWSWKERAETALWKLADSEECPRWVVDFLFKGAEERADSGRLFKLSRLLVAAEPANVAFRNRFIALALLTRSQVGSPERLAKTLHDENPGNADVTATYALSLCLRGHEKDAVSALKTLRPEQLREPRVALYYGIALAGVGEAEKAAEYLQIGAPAARLPEEKALLTKANSPATLGAVRS